MAGNIKEGRPLLFKNKEELQEKIDEYFQLCEENVGFMITKEGEKITIDKPLIPTIAGLAYHLGVDRGTIYNYQEKDEFFNTIKNARDYILSKIESKLCNVDGNIGGTIFLAKNYGYKDSQEVTNINVFSENVKQKIKEIEDNVF